MCIKILGAHPGREGMYTDSRGDGIHAGCWPAYMCSRVCSVAVGSNTEAIRRAVKLFRYVLTRQEEGWVFESNKRGETGRIMRILRPEDDTDPE